MMGATWFFFFGEKDEVLVKEIAKTHNVSKEVVEKHYKKMLEDVKNEVSNKVED